jgi:hypothetical protein
MRSVTTVLLLGALVLVPLIAVFGIPEFVPVVASSPSRVDAGSNDFASGDFTRHGRSAVGESSRYFPDDLFAAIEQEQQTTQPPIRLEHTTQPNLAEQDVPLGNWQVDAARDTPPVADARPFRRSPRNAKADRRALTWRDAVAHLNQLGIRDFRLQPGRQPNSFHFSCSLTPADNPRITRRFEAEASEQLEAVAKVLTQVDAWLEQR